MSHSFQVALKLEGKPCLVVGSSREAKERALGLARAGARVVVVAPEPSAELDELASEANIDWQARNFREADLDGKWLAVLADADSALAARVASAAEARRVFFCAIDRPEHNSFSHVALARAGLVTLAVGTEGEAPALAKKLREELQKLVDAANLAEFAADLAELRRRTPSEKRREVLGAAVSGVAFEGKLVLARDRR